MAESLFKYICCAFFNDVGGSDPGAQLRYFNDLEGGEGSDRGSYFISKKSQLQNLSTPKIPTFLA